MASPATQALTSCAPPPSGPPSAPRSIVTQINDTTLSLEWNEPLYSGGRSDLSYSVRCSVCRSPSGPCLPCRDSVSYRPAQHGLLGRRLEVWGLLPHTTYSFTIQALNGVSQLSGKEPAGETVNITTSHDGERRTARRCRGKNSPSVLWYLYLFCHLCSAVAGVRDSEERLDGEQPDAALVHPGSPALRHPAVPAPLLREGETAARPQRSQPSESLGEKTIEEA